MSPVSARYPSRILGVAGSLGFRGLGLRVAKLGNFRIKELQVPTLSVGRDCLRLTLFTCSHFAEG